MDDGNRCDKAFRPQRVVGRRGGGTTAQSRANSSTRVTSNFCAKARILHIEPSDLIMALRTIIPQIAKVA
jgi:hypothetical protein